MRSRSPISYALFGAAPDTSNRGVSALFRCVLDGVGDALPDSRLVVFDTARGVREQSEVLASGADYRFTRVGARGGRRYYAPENLATMAAFASAGRAWGRLHPYIRILDRCDAVLDVSAGDSFSDIYGEHRFQSIVRPKLIAKRRGIPLVLLPQTYGPFRDDRNRRIAREAVLGARMAWARDGRSFEALKRLLGEDFDGSRHREGVDMAFNLGTADPGKKLGVELRRWIDEAATHPLVGINVSGLIALDPKEAKQRFHFRADYVAALRELSRTLLEQSEARLVLVPHVMAEPGHPESDTEACRNLAQALDPEQRARVDVAPRNLDEREVKWLISKLHWFCGTRMHSTIAALSSNVPTAAIAYSDKTLGVFQSCGVGDQVVDPRELDTREVVARLKASFDDREEIARTLSTRVDVVKARAFEQSRCTTDLLKSLVPTMT